MAIYGYCRVSTRGQIDGNSLEGQKEQILKDYPTAIIVEEQVSGAKAIRPKFDELLKQLNDGDMLVVTKLDRFARSLLQGSATVDELIKRGVRVNILNMGTILDNSPNSKLIRNIFFSFAEFERDMIYERTQEGKAIARQRGDYREGRPRKFNPAKVEEALNYVEAGNSYKKTAEIFGISKTTLIRRMQERQAKQMKAKELENKKSPLIETEYGNFRDFTSLHVFMDVEEFRRIKSTIKCNNESDSRILTLEEVEKLAKGDLK